MRLVGANQFEKATSVRHVPRDSRAVLLLPYFDAARGEWELLLPHGDGELVAGAGIEPISMSYLAAQPVTPTDVELSVGALIANHLSFPPVVEQLHRLEHGVHRFSAILEKYHLIWSLARSHIGASALISSELEYLIVTLRAFYDALQGVARAIGKRLVLLQDPTRRALQELPRSFADTTLTDGKRRIRSEEELGAKFGMPQPLSQWYAAEAAFFLQLRELRDALLHDGKRLPPVFKLEWGFALDPTDQPWNRFEEWPVGRRWEGRLGSLRVLFASFVVHTIQAAARFESIIRVIVSLPEPVFRDGLRYFVRSEFGARLARLEAMREQPWEGLDGGEGA